MCFNAPAVELLLSSEEKRHSALTGLGPDVLNEDAAIDFDECAVTREPALEIGVLLPEQQVVSGIGNIYRCESLFLDRWNRSTPQSQLTDSQLDHPVATAMNA